MSASSNSTKKTAYDFAQKIKTNTLATNELVDLQVLLENFHISDPAANPAKFPKIASPQFYDGSRKELRDFVTQIKMNINVQRSRFPDEASKICYTCSFLRGPAFSWAQPYVEEMGSASEPDFMKSFSSFVKELCNAFGEPDEVSTAEQALAKLKQGSDSAAEYAAMFRRLASRTGWNDAALKFAFRSGLTEHIKDELATRDMPEKFNDYIQMVIKLDNRIREREAEKRLKYTFKSSQTKPRLFHMFPDSKPAQVPEQPSTSDITPMEIDATRKKYSPLSSDEKRRRHELNLCLYCGGNGHRANVCPRKFSPLGKARTQSQ